MPDAADRELLGNAIGLGCDAFATADMKRIVSEHHRVADFFVQHDFFQPCSTPSPLTESSPFFICVRYPIKKSTIATAQN